MKYLIKTIYAISIISTIVACKSAPPKEIDNVITSVGEEFTINNEKYTIDTFRIDIADSSEWPSVISDSDIKANLKIAVAEESLDEFIDEIEQKENLTSIINDVIKKNNDPIKIPVEFQDCWPARPTKLNQMTDGLELTAREFTSENQTGLAVLGFGGKIEKNEKVIVIQFFQKGSQICNNNILKWGFGARLKMHVKSNRKRAKLNTPQQLTASVMFGLAEVTYEMKTYGIVGPGTANLVKLGAVTENTYQDFLKGVADLLVNIYNNQSDYIITPQPLFLELKLVE